MDILYQVVTKRLSECFKQPGSFIFKTFIRGGVDAIVFGSSELGMTSMNMNLLKQKKMGFFNLNIGVAA